MLSMTGYGRATLEQDGRTISVEMKSVNHRFLDVSFRMPRNLMFLEDELRRDIGARMARGHVEVSITYRNLRADARTVQVDRALFSAYESALDQIAGSGLADDRTLMEIARLPDVLVVTEAEEDQDAVRALARSVLEKAINALLGMRAREGMAMAEDLAQKINRIEALTLAVEARYPETVKAYTERLRASIEELIGQKVDETRLLTEVAIMADRSAIAEETVRLKSHLIQLRQCLKSDEPVGRRLDFLVQELNREVNTITSKSQDIPITQIAVDLKAEIEKLREQLQNVE